MSNDTYAEHETADFQPGHDRGRRFPETDGPPSRFRGKRGVGGHRRREKPRAFRVASLDAPLSAHPRATIDLDLEFCYALGDFILHNECQNTAVVEFARCMMELDDMVSDQESDR